MTKPAKQLRKKFAHAAGKKTAKEQPFNVAIVKFHGSLEPDMDGGDSISWDRFERPLAMAFGWKGCKAVVLDIDCPGGSPSEAEMIGREIRYQAKRHNIPVYAFVRGMATSGGYWLACAADKIYALPTSDIGSIGVISAGFGFHKKNRKEGVERRVFTAGTEKSQMDPHKPLKKKDVKLMKEELRQLHRVFKDWIIERRGKRLHGTEASLMNGNSWIGQKALDRGLVDGLGDMKNTMAKIAGKHVNYMMFEPENQQASLADLLAAAMAQVAGEDKNAPGSRKSRQRYLALDTRPRPRF